MSGDRERPVPALAPLRVRPYRRMWFSMSVSHLGTYLQLTAGPWLMLQMTGSPLWVALVTTALFLPRLLFILPSGSLADVVDRRTILIVCHSLNAGSTGLLAWVTYQGRLTPTLLLALMFALGVGTAVSTPAYQTYLPDLVPQRLRAQAITMNSAAHQGALIIGPSIGGALVAFDLAELAFAGNALSFIVLVLVLIGLPRVEIEREDGAPASRSIAEGLRFVRGHRGLRRLVYVAAVFTLATSTVQALLPNVVAVDLGASAQTFGIMYAVFGVGALTATVTRERVALRLGHRFLPSAIAGFACAAIAFGAAVSVPLAGAALFLAGLTWVWTLTTFKATVQIMAPQWVRGRVVAVYLLAVAMKPVGAFLGGLVAEFIGAGSSVMTWAVLTAVVSVVAARAGLPVLGTDGIRERRSRSRPVPRSTEPAAELATRPADPPSPSWDGAGGLTRSHPTSSSKGDPPMQTTTITIGSFRVPALGLGCMGMSGRGKDEEESRRTLRRAQDAGIEMFDTADKYGKGHNETLVGQALAPVRDQVRIATKCGFVGSPGDERPVDGRPEHVFAACDASLRRLGTEVIDLYYLHRVDPLVPIEETVGAMAALVEQGKVREIGLSEVTVETLARAVAIHPIAAVQSEYSLWTRELEEAVLPYCREHSIALVGYSPLGIGFLTGRYRDPDDLPDGNRLRRGPRMSEEHRPRNLELLDRFEALAESEGFAPAQLALAWALHQPGVLPIPGASTLEHLEENLVAASISLDEGLRSTMDGLFAPGAVAGSRKTAAGLQLVR